MNNELIIQDFRNSVSVIQLEFWKKWDNDLWAAVMSEYMETVLYSGEIPEDSIIADELYKKCDKETILLYGDDGGYE